MRYWYRLVGQVSTENVLKILRPLPGVSPDWARRRASGGGPDAGSWPRPGPQRGWRQGRGPGEQGSL